MNCTISPRFRFFSHFRSFPITRTIRVSHIPFHAASVLTRASQPSSNSMSQPASTADPNTLTIPNDPPENADVVVQYVVLRRDLIDTWPLGSVVTQGCHASVSAVWSNKDDPLTLDYCSPEKIDFMHKVSISFFFLLMNEISF